MKKLLTIATAMVFALSFGIAYADQMPGPIDANKDLGIELSNSFIAHDAGMKTDTGRVYSRYADFPTITDLRNSELGVVLSKAFVTHDVDMKVATGAAAGGLGAEKAVTKDIGAREYLNAKGSDLP